MPPGAVSDSLALATARAELQARLVTELPAAASSVAIATLALLALLFFLKDRSRREILLYAILAAGVALLVAGRIRSFDALPFPPALKRSLLEELVLLLPPLGFLFVIRFVDLPVRALHAALLPLPIAGAILVAAPGLLPRLSRDALSGASVALLASAALATLAGARARRRKDAGLLFVGTATLLLAVALDEARSSGVLLAGGPPLLGPGFLLFTTLLLVAVADEGRRLLTRATTDPLTHLANRAAFLDRAILELVRASRTERAFAVAMLDVDHFKTINDRFGHPAGDRVLAAVARAIAETLRGVDVCGRYGGEEFVLLLVEVDEPAAFVAVQRVRDAIASLAPPQIARSVTVSAGIAVHHPLFERATISELIRRADAALYQSKSAGRDRTTMYEGGAKDPSSAAEVRYR